MNHVKVLVNKLFHKMSKKFFLIFSLLALAVVSRWAPHTFNFTPVLAIALFSGMYISNKTWAFAIPAVALIVSDSLLGFYSGSLMLSIYGSYALIVSLGILSKGSFKPLRLLGTSMGSALIFFLVTNFAVWFLAETALGGIVYERSWSGLWKCYLMALPFFRATLVSTVLMSFALVGAYEWVIQRGDRYHFDKSSASSGPS